MICRENAINCIWETAGHEGQCCTAQDIQQSPQMIDAIQMMLSDPSSYAPLVEHPELAPYMRALRRCAFTLFSSQFPLTPDVRHQ